MNRPRRSLSQDQRKKLFLWLTGITFLVLAINILVLPDPIIISQSSYNGNVSREYAGKEELLQFAVYPVVSGAILYLAYRKCNRCETKPHRPQRPVRVLAFVGWLFMLAGVLGNVSVLMLNILQ